MTLVMRMAKSPRLISPSLKGEEILSEEPSVEKKLLLMMKIWNSIVMGN